MKKIVLSLAVSLALILIITSYMPVSTSPGFTISLTPIKTKNYLPGLQSFVWATSGNYLLLIGGRTEGFHGLTNDDTTFKVRKANDSIFVINMSDYTYRALALNTKDPDLFQFSSSNMEFKQDGDTLYMVGGFGVNDTTSLQSNYTFNRMVAIRVSAMIKLVITKGNPANAIIGRAMSPLLAVTGGELIKQNGIFYLMFGQKYTGIYDMTNSGAYTSAVRSFRFSNNTITNTSSFIDTSNLHRRDLNVAPIMQKSGWLYAGYGGVFTSKLGSYDHPVYLSLNGANVSLSTDTLTQVTNQYECAKAFIYDPGSNTNYTVLFGGIGEYQYNTASKKWLYGDNGAMLPFVNSITQLVYQNGSTQQKIQIPPGQPTMPGLIGADAIFIPTPSLLYADRTIDLSKVGANAPIGIIYGGIRSLKPTSSGPYPTSLNKTIYKVYLHSTSVRKRISR